MEPLLAHYDQLVIVTVALGLLMAWGIGANDLSNSVGPAVGAKVINLREATVLAIIFEVAGALLYGSRVTETLGGGIIDTSIGYTQPLLVVQGMLASLLAAALWLAVASAKGWPVSTTHSIVGAMVGFALAGMGMDAIHWEASGWILGAWLVSPLAGGLLAYLIMKSIMWLVLNSKDPVRSTRRWIPLYVFVTGFLVCLVTFTQGLRPLGVDIGDDAALVLALMLAAGMALFGVLVGRIREARDVEQAFAPITIFTVCSMAFAHGSNDVANAIGPVKLALELLRQGSVQSLNSGAPFWIFLLGGGGIALGVATLGFRVVRTVGQDITPLTPCRAFTVALAATATVVFATSSGFPVSTTHTVVGAVLGVGLAGAAGAVRYGVILARDPAVDRLAGGGDLLAVAPLELKLRAAEGTHRCELLRGSRDSADSTSLMIAAAEAGSQSSVRARSLRLPRMCSPMSRATTTAM